jgi:hypothetical protein
LDKNSEVHNIDFDFNLNTDKINIPEKFAQAKATESYELEEKSGNVIWIEL